MLTSHFLESSGKQERHGRQYPAWGWCLRQYLVVALNQQVEPWVSPFLSFCPSVLYNSFAEPMEKPILKNLNEMVSL